MLRWNDVAETTIFGMTLKMYREPFKSDSTFVSPLSNLELDHYAYKYMGSELDMYKILDINFENYIENRGDLNRVEGVEVPIREDLTRSIF